MNYDLNKHYLNILNSYYNDYLKGEAMLKLKKYRLTVETPWGVLGAIYHNISDDYWLTYQEVGAKKLPDYSSSFSGDPEKYPHLFEEVKSDYKIVDEWLERLAKWSRQHIFGGEQRRYLSTRITNDLQKLGFDIQKLETLND